MNTFLLAFIPIFVAMDPIGIAPIYISFTKDMDAKKRNRVTVEALGAAFAVTVAFMFVGNALLAALGLKLADFQIAGGILLLVLSIQDMSNPTKETRDPGDKTEVGVVPLGIPLIAGPAMLTTELVLIKQYGIVPTGAALVANFIVMGISLMISQKMTRFLGEAGIRAVSKIISLLLAAIAVMLIRIGIEAIIRGA